MTTKQKLFGVAPIVLGLAYGASPIDLIPDVIPLIGYLDDAILVPLLIIMGFVQYRKHSKGRDRSLKSKN